MLDDAAPDGVRLDAQGAVQVRAVHPAVLCEDVAGAARDLAPDDHPAVPVLHLASADDHVLDGCRQPPPVGVAAGLERDAVVAGVEVAILDEHVAARLRVAAVVVGPVADDAYAAHDDVCAEDRVDLPHRRVRDRHALDEHVAATVGLYELRAQVVAFAEDTLLDRHPALGHLEEPVAAFLLVHAARRPAVLFAALPRPPVHVVGLPVERTAARDGHVLLLEGVDERRVVHHLDALPAREDGRQVRLRLAPECHGRPLRDVQVDAREKPDGPRQEAPRRHDDAPPAGRGARFDRLPERRGAVGRAVAHTAESGDVEVAVREDRRAYPCQNLPHHRPRVVDRSAGGACGRRAAQRSARQHEHGAGARGGLEEGATGQPWWLHGWLGRLVESASRGRTGNWPGCQQVDNSPGCQQAAGAASPCAPTEAPRPEALTNSV